MVFVSHLSLSFHSSFSFFDNLPVNQWSWNQTFSQIANIPCKSIATCFQIQKQHVATLLWKQLQLALPCTISFPGMVQPATSVGSYLHVAMESRDSIAEGTIWSYATHCYANVTLIRHDNNIIKIQKNVTKPADLSEPDKDWSVLRFITHTKCCETSRMTTFHRFNIDSARGTVKAFQVVKRIGVLQWCRPLLKPSWHHMVCFLTLNNLKYS